MGSTFTGNNFLQSGKQTRDHKRSPLEKMGEKHVVPTHPKMCNNSKYMYLNTFSQSGPGCSKLTRSLVNILLKFQTLISQIFQYFLSKKSEMLLHFNKKIQSI